MIGILNPEQRIPVERLTHESLLVLLKNLRKMYAHLDFETLPSQLLSILPKVIRSDSVSYNEFELVEQKCHWVIDPPEIDFPNMRPIFDQLYHEHPLVDFYSRTGDGRAWKISDFLSQSSYHRLALYNEFYQRTDTEYQMVINLPAPPSLLIGFAFNREKGRKDFSDSDRQILNILRPHVHQAYHNAIAFTRMQQQVDQMIQTLQESGQGMIVLDEEGDVQQMTESAQQWLVEYFGRQLPHTLLLPDDLRRWITRQRSLLALDDKVPPPCIPLVVERENKRLLVRFLTDRFCRSFLLLREERQTDLTPASLKALGLGQREAEVLYWVAKGKTNAEAATILDMSTRTVDKHLERIYNKLGVETRTAAISHSLEALGILRWAPVS